MVLDLSLLIMLKKLLLFVAISVTTSLATSQETQAIKTPNSFDFTQGMRTKVAVYADGRNTSQKQIAEQVKQRLVSIVSDSI